MDWLTNLLKHLEASRTFVAIAFFTALVLYIGPRLAPTFVDAVPQGWGWVVVGTLVFCGGLSITWAVQTMLTRARAWRQKRMREREWKDLPAEERGLLLYLAEQGPTKWHLLDDVQGSPTRLKLAEMAKYLQRVGLVDLSREQGSARLTDDGTTLALRMQSDDAPRSQLGKRAPVRTGRFAGVIRLRDW